MKFRRQTCVANEYPSLVDNFIDSIYVVSMKEDYSAHLRDHFLTDDAMFKNCTPRVLDGETDEVFKFTVDEW